MLRIIRFSVFLCLLACTQSAFAQRLFEALVTVEQGLPQGVSAAPLVSIRALDSGEVDVMKNEVGGSFQYVPEAKRMRSVVKPLVPEAVRREGRTVSLELLIRVNEAGEVEKIYRIGEEADDCFIECAKALRKWRFKTHKQSTYYKVVQNFPY